MNLSCRKHKPKQQQGGTQRFRGVPVSRRSSKAALWPPLKSSDKSTKCIIMKGRKLNRVEILLHKCNHKQLCIILHLFDGITEVSGPWYENSHQTQKGHDLKFRDSRFDTIFVIQKVSLYLPVASKWPSTTTVFDAQGYAERIESRSTGRELVKVKWLPLQR